MISKTYQMKATAAFRKSWVPFRYSLRSTSKKPCIHSGRVRQGLDPPQAVSGRSILYVVGVIDLSTELPLSIKSLRSIKDMSLVKDAAAS